MAKDALAQLSAPRNHAKANAERLAIADQLTFWRCKCADTTDPMRLASYRRIIHDLVEIAERDTNAGN